MTVHVARCVASISFLCVVLLVNAEAAEPSDQSNRTISGDHRLPCNGEVSLYYGEELIWRKGAGEIRAIKGLVEIPDEAQKGISGLQLASLLALRSDVAAIELESCQPRLRRFERAELESDNGSALYLVATNYRGFRLRNVSRERGGGGGMKNIGKIVLVPAAGKPGEKSGNRTDDNTSGTNVRRRHSGSGDGKGQGTGQGTGKNSNEKPD